ncbi:MAG TPA: hypothetical protein VEA81_00190 [Burkholderiaceae bacterium]|nr:hypothetical protein [Burkholderiaceae bacterium]
MRSLCPPFESSYECAFGIAFGGGLGVACAAGVVLLVLAALGKFDR